MKTNRNKLVGANPPEAWATPTEYDEDTCVTKPSEEAVVESKLWVDENHK
ncbi:MAG: DUF3787 domain-containing protein [Dethiosulfatibacter sp.]|nr:DUF3787 domain-containing protein [Dethiosulfatibacter sp.]